MNQSKRGPSGWSPYSLAIGPQSSPRRVGMAKYKMFFNPSKAINELGLYQTPPQQALRDAVAWFREHGYVRR